MEDSGSVEVDRQLYDQEAGVGRAILAVVLAGAIVTYGGVSLFVAFFVIAPMAEAMFQSGGHPAAPDGRRPLGLAR